MDARMSGYEELLALADAATPGPWTSRDSVVWRPSLRSPRLDIGLTNYARDADFIGAANPTAVKALVEEVLALRGKVERVEALADELDNESATDMWDQGQFYAVQLRAALGDDR